MEIGFPVLCVDLSLTLCMRNALGENQLRARSLPCLRAQNHAPPTATNAIRKKPMAASSIFRATICIRKIPRCSAKRCQAGRRIHGCHTCARKPGKQRTRSAIRRKPPRKQTRRHDGATGTTPPTRDECK